MQSTRVDEGGIIDISVVIPVYNEAENIRFLAEEIVQALANESCEIIFVDDGSDDDSESVFNSIAAELPCTVRMIRHSRNLGQSRAILTGVRQANSPVIATLDGDCQNNPADIPGLLTFYRQNFPSGTRMVAGQRTHREDNWVRKVSSRIANTVRNWFLHDGISDTGCGLKVFDRDIMLSLPFFDHLHRFMPAMFKAAGWDVIQMPVDHRRRHKGVSKYGVSNRLWIGISDLFGVRWLIKRTPPHANITEKKNDRVP